eukprot:1585763-Prymnesium_polylepis.1
MSITDQHHINASSSGGFVAQVVLGVIYRTDMVRMVTFSHRLRPVYSEYLSMTVEMTKIGHFSDSRAPSATNVTTRGGQTVGRCRSGRGGGASAT